MIALLTLSIAALIGAVLYTEIANYIGNLIESYRQTRWVCRHSNREESMTQEQLVLSQLAAAVAAVVSRLDAIEARQVQPKTPRPIPVDLTAVNDVPWFDGPVTDDGDQTEATVVSAPSVPTKVKARAYHDGAHGQGFVRRVEANGNTYRVPNRLSLVECGGMGNVYTWVGRKGQSTYGVLLGIAQGVRHVQIVSPDTLKARSRVVQLPEHAQRLSGPTTPQLTETAPVASPVRQEPAPADKSLVCYASKRTGLIARNADNRIKFDSTEDTTSAVGMIRRGFVPHSLTLDEATHLDTLNPKHYPTR